VDDRRPAAPMARREEGAYSPYVTPRSNAACAGWIGAEDDRVMHSRALPGGVGDAQPALGAKPVDDRHLAVGEPERVSVERQFAARAIDRNGGELLAQCRCHSSCRRS
jgi:hypothetical protein